MSSRKDGRTGGTSTTVQTDLPEYPTSHIGRDVLPARLDIRLDIRRRITPRRTMLWSVLSARFRPTGLFGSHAAQGAHCRAGRALPRTPNMDDAGGTTGRSQRGSGPQRSGEPDIGPLRRRFISGSFGDPALDRADRAHHFKVWGPRIRSRLWAVSAIALFGSLGRLYTDTQLNSVRSEQWLENFLANFQMPLMVVTFVMVMDRYGIFTAENYERVFFGSCLLNSAASNVALVPTLLSRKELPAEVEYPGMPPELQVTFLTCTATLARVNLYCVTVFFLVGLRPFPALILCILDTVFTFVRRRQQLLFGLPAISGPIPAAQHEQSAPLPAATRLLSLLTHA